MKNNLFGENYFKKGLNDLFTAVVNLDETKSEKEARLLAANKFYEFFSNANLIIKGSEHLPYQSSSIFIYNHLNNNPDYLIGSDFQITLDSHFISSFILNKYYKKPGIRIVRCSLENEKKHKSYYDRFGYIRVFSKNFIPKNFDTDKIRKFNLNFFQNALKELENNNGIIISPEGLSQETENSPGSFKSGAFKIAVEHQLPICPMVFLDCKRKFPWYTTHGYPGQLRVDIHPPLSTKGLTESDIPMLQQKTYDLIYSELQNDPRQMAVNAIEVWKKVTKTVQ